MTLKDLLEQFFIDRGYSNHVHYHSKLPLVRGPSGAWDLRFINNNNDVIRVRSYKSHEIELVYNRIVFKKVDIRDPESFDCLERYLEAAKEIVDRLLKE